jgi:hypothetical protein
MVRSRYRTLPMSPQRTHFLLVVKEAHWRSLSMESKTCPEGARNSSLLTRAASHCRLVTSNIAPGADHLSAETHAAFAFAATMLWHDH